MILNLAYFLGVVLVGAAIGAMVVTMIWGRSGSEPHVLIVILFAVVGAVAAMQLQRYVIVTGTAFGGAWTALVGAPRARRRPCGGGGRVGQQRVGGVSAGSGARPALGDSRVAGARAGRPGRAAQARSGESCKGEKEEVKKLAAGSSAADCCPLPAARCQLSAARYLTPVRISTVS